MSDTDGSDDCAGLLKQALNVDMPDDFNPNVIPQTGEEYLQHVIYERNKCKKWISAEIDKKKFEKNQTFKIEVDEIIKTVDKEFMPTLEWQQRKVADFIELRDYVQSKIEKEPTQNMIQDEKFILEARNSYPQFSKITLFSQASKISMLQMISKHLESLNAGESINDNLGAWIYANLALLEIPLSPSSCHTLRELAKKCIVIRSKLNANQEYASLYAPLNLCICIVARFFNQIDLAD